MNAKVAWGLGLALLATPLLAAADGGRVSVTSTDLQLVRHTAQSSLHAGSTLSSGDTIRSGKGGNTQLWMEDDSILVLGPSSDVRLVAMDKRRQRAEYGLAAGGLRVVSGHINPVVTTVMASVHAGPSDFSSLICGDGCDGPRGLYVRVDTGQVSVGNSHGHLAAVRGQIVFVASVNDAPVFVSRMPQQMVTLLAALSIQIDPLVDVDTQLRLQVPEQPPSPS